MVGWFLNVLFNNKAISLTGPKTERLTILHPATHETELGDHDFCLSRHIILTSTQPVGSRRPSGNRTRDLLTRSRALYRLSYRAPQWHSRVKKEQDQTKILGDVILILVVNLGFLG